MTTGPVMLELFAGAGGCTAGYQRAGFTVVAGDLSGNALKRNPAEIRVTGDWLDVAVQHLATGKVQAVHASPPCWLYSITNAARRQDYPDLIGPVREWCISTGLPYVIENVPRAPLRDPLVLCGSMFDLRAVDDDGTPLRLERHRLFESNLPLVAPKPDRHDKRIQVAGSYGGARRDKYEARHIRKGGYVPSKAVQERLMGIDWMTQQQLYQAIPPVYTEHIGLQLLQAINHQQGEQSA